MDVSGSLTTRTFVLSMLRPDGSLEAGELYDVGSACGFTVDQVRLCLARLVREGVLDQTGRGRKAILEATARGRSEIEPTADFIRLAWAQDRGEAGWDGSWHLVGFTIDEERRTARNALREYIVDVLSGATVAGGLYVSPHDWDDLVRAVARDLGVEDRVTFIRSDELVVGTERDPRALARALWDLDRLGGEWAGFVDGAHPVLQRLSPDAVDAADPAAALAEVVAVVTRWGEIMTRDPLLPPELLPAGWPGTTARRVLAEAVALVRELRDEAQVPALFRRFDDVMTEITDQVIDGRL